MHVDTLEDLYPLTPLQQGMLFHALYTPGSSAYFEQFTCRLVGALDVDAFRRAWQQVLDRHPALRTGFEWEELEEPVQIVYGGLELPFELLDWRHVPAEDRLETIEALLAEDRERGFDPKEPPLLRVFLAQLGEGEYFLLWSHHHMLLDGWCLGSIFREIFAFYQAFSRGETRELPSPRPFRDYIAWLQEQDPERPETYWRQALEGFSEATDPGVVATAKEGAAPDIRQVELRLAVEKTTALEGFARQARVTLATLVQGIWALLLARYAESQDVTFGVTVSGRPADLRGAESMVGLFINTLPFRTRVPRGLPLGEWLSRLQAQGGELRDLEHTPLVEIQRWSEIAADRPLFESHLTFENYPVDAGFGELEGLGLEMHEPRLLERTHYPLSLLAAPGERLKVLLGWDAERVEKDAAHRLFDHLLVLLESFPGSTDRSLEELPILGLSERLQVLSEWNDTARVLAGSERSLDELVVEQARRTPEAVAVEADGRCLSYHLLLAKADDLAHALGGLGVGPEVRVGIALERSLELMVGLLGILRVGGAFVPLDPSQPKPRLSLILEDLAHGGEPPLILTRNHEAAALPEGDFRQLQLDEPLPEVVGDRVSPRSNPHGAAYVLYTSGSTGRPKGAVNSHRAIVNRLLWMQRAYRLSSADHVLQKTPISFDVSVWEFFWPLLTGSRLVFLEPGGHLDAEALVATMRSRRITTLHFVPSMLRLFLVHPESELCRDLRQVVLSGEGLPADLKDLFFDRLGDAGVELHNLYGPTEAAIDVSYQPCSRRFEGAVEPIGRPIDNLRLYVLGRDLRPRPMGLSGEVHIAGVGLARGYLNRPALTAATFVPDPLARDLASNRLYKTGDLGRQRADGVIEFLGRIDFQVKIRGVRIELGEIGAVLGRHPGVGDCAVVARPDNAGDLALVAYVVPAASGPVDLGELRAYLGDHLPASMVPQSWTMLEVLPKTASGKLDRRALPDPDLKRHRDAPLAPRTPYEEALVEIWSEVLGLEDIGVHDAFFDLGGHSLRAMQVMSRIRRAFDRDLPLRTLFEASTVARLARVLEGELASARITEPLLPRQGEEDPPLSLAQQRLWFFDQLQPGSSFYNLTRALRLSGDLRSEVLEAALAEVVRRHEALRTTVHTENGEGIQRIAPAETPFHLPMIDLSGLEGREAAARQVILREARRPFDLASGPLFRANLLRLAEEQQILLLVMHHIISDGWSMDLLLRETVTLYRAASVGQPSPLPELEVQYPDYALWQRRWLSGEVLEEQLSWWRERLGDPPVVELPLDRPRPHQHAFRGERLHFRLDAEVSEELRALGRQEGATLFMVLATGLFAWLHRVTGLEDLVVGTPVANRGRREIESLVGFFVNTLVVRGRFPDDPSFEEALDHVREQCLGAYAHQDLPFERLVNEVAPERDLGRSPLFQVMLALESPAPFHFEGLEVEAVPVDLGAEIFDLSLALREGEGGVEGWLGTRGDLFDRTTAERFRRGLQTVFEAVAEDPEQVFSELPLLGAAERQQVLREWGEGPVASSLLAPGLHGLVRRRVDQSAEAVALVWDGEGGQSLAWTYRQLARAAAAIRRSLEEHGVGAEEPVGLFLERGPELVAAVLGVLEAGAAFVPLDPEQPKERLAGMARDAGLRLVLTWQDLPVDGLHLLAPRVRPAVVVEPEPLAPVDTSRALAVFYTSGSTGRPKGVTVTQGGLSNRLLWAETSYPVTEEDRVLAVASPGFDISLWETFGALFAGGTTVLAPPSGAKDMGWLTGALVRQRITLAHFVPSVLSLLLEEEPAVDLSSLRYLLTGGDKVPADMPGRVFERWSGRMHSQYGPTEASINATYEVCRPGAPERRSLPIGRVLDGAVVRLLDRRGEPVSLGVAGEIHIGGVGVARGYHGRPAATAAAFVPDMSGPRGGRLYRTGDRARFLADGSLEFLGRTDRQVKIRGVRVELAEVEAILASHAAVAEAALVTTAGSTGARLVAFVEPAAEAAVEVSEVREFAAQRLSQAMVPSAIQVLDKLPRNVNGKLDRRALPDAQRVLDEKRPEGASAGDPPRGRREELLAEVWAELLDLPSVSREANFFELGGDSILGIQLVSRARRRGLELGARQVFEHQTLAALARVASESTPAEKVAEEVLGDAPLTPIQQHAFQRSSPRAPRFSQTVTLELSKDLTPAELDLALGKLVEHHSVLRARFVEEEGTWRLRVPSLSPQAWKGLQCADLAHLGGEEVEPAVAALEADLSRALDAVSGPLFAALLVDLGAGFHSRLVLAIHHLVVDGVSWRILLEDLDGACANLERGKPIDLPPRTTPWVQWARDLERVATSSTMGAEAEFWRRMVRQDAARLPVDFEGRSNSRSSARSVERVLDPELTRRALEEAPSAYHTGVEDLLLTALLGTLAKASNTSHLRLDLEGHGRTEELENADLSRTVGWFTTRFPVLFEFADSVDTSPGENLCRVKETLRTLPGKGVGYGLLRYFGQDSEAAALVPREPTEVAFNYLGRLDRAVLGGRFRPLSTGGLETAEREHLLEVEARIAEDSLRVRFVFGENRHREETVERWAEDFESRLRDLVDHCTAPGAGGYTPSDFPLAALDRRTLERVTQGLNPRADEALADLYPLSPMQQGLLFHALDEDEDNAYFNQLVGELQGQLDPEHLRESWRRVLERHAVFRTDFLWEGLKRPLQAVRRRVEMPWRIEDWSNLSVAEQEARRLRFLEEDRAQGFDLGHAPLLRLAVLRCGPERWWFVWSHHHLLVDGWSLPLLLQEVFQVYESLVQKTSTGLGPVVPYREYIAWLMGQDQAAADAYWRRRLGAVDAPSPLGVDRPVAMTESPESAFAKVERHLPGELAEGLSTLARRHRVTLGTLLQGVWGLLLGRYGGRDRVVFGLVASGRPAELPGVESMLGLFINTLPVRVDLPRDQPVERWLEDLQGEASELLRYEFSPLASVQRLSGVTQGIPLFESLFAFENFPVDEAVAKTWAGVRVAGVQFRERTNYPLCITALPGQDLRLEIDFDIRRFDRITTLRILQHMENLLKDFCERPTGRLGEFSPLGPRERAQLLVEWNGAAEELPRHPPVHRLVAEQAALHPEAPAVVAPGIRWSYGEMWRRALRVARVLGRRGIGPEHVVGLAMAPGPHLAEALLGILEAGAAYLPLDPSYPAARLRTMMEDAGVAWVLCHGELAIDLGSVGRLDLEEIVREPLPEEGFCGPEIHTEGLAYLVYTSGSTGRPKGVLTSHGGLTHYTRNMVQRLGLGPEERVLQFAPLSFDVLAEEVFPTWVSGGAVVFEESEAVQDVTSLGDVIARHGVTWVELPASFWHEWVDHLELVGERPPTSLRRVLVGCDRPSPERLKLWRSTGIPIVVVFGLTETTITNTLFFWRGERETRLPIGRPMADNQIYVLDPAGRVMPQGASGELWVGGVGVVRGYHGSPRLTAERFLPDPFAAERGESGSRLYRTGDRARFAADGCLEFLGRLDVQAKVRGFRVEPLEIERALGQHPAVREVAVRVQELGVANRRLVAWHVAEPEPVPAELREFLLERVPEYMVPSVFVGLEALPKTPSGKVDHRSLPLPDRPTTATDHVAPRTAVEQTLAEVLTEVLGVEGVGVHDNFFELGGDSILSIQIVSRARHLGLRFSPQDLFRHPTVAELAPRVRAGSAVVDEVGEVVGDVPLTPIQHWFFGRKTTRPEHFNLSLMLSSSEPWRLDLLEAALAHLVRRHDALRLRFEPPAEDGAPWRQHCLAEGRVPAGTYDLRGLPSAGRQAALEALLADLQGSLDLENGPLFRAVLLVLGDSEHRLFLLAHHLVVDAVSWRILVEDLEKVQAALRAGEPVRLAPTTPFGAWSQALTETSATSRPFQAEEPFWVRQLWHPEGSDEAGSDIPSLPLDHNLEPAVVNTVAAARSLTHRLSAEATGRLLRGARERLRASAQELLLAALTLAFRDWTGSDRLLLELEAHGRGEEGTGMDLSRTVGWLTAIHPLVLEARDSPGETLVGVKEALRRIPGGGVGWGVLRWLAEGENDLARCPVPQVLFNYLGQLEGPQGGAPSGPALAKEGRGPEIDPGEARDHLLELNAGILGGGEESYLECTFTYGTALHRRETVDVLALSFLDHLEHLLDQVSEERALAPSDFPLATFDRRWLGELVESLEEAPEEIYPLSPMQEGMLFHVLYDPTAGMYIAQFDYEVQGHLDPVAFEAAWDGLVERHGALRTGFFRQGLEVPLQVVTRGEKALGEILDWRGVDPDNLEARLAEWRSEDRTLGFDLVRPPLLRWRLVRTEAERYRLLLTLNQMVVDGWSMPILFRELFTLYAAAAAGREAELPPAPRYAAYIEWLQRKEREEEKAYWRHTLADFEEPTPLPHDPAAGGEGQGSVTRRIFGDGGRALVRRARETHSTLNTLVQGAWGTLLARYANRREAVFGVVVSGRPAELSGIEDMVGMFLNTLPLRLRLGDEKVSVWLAELQTRQAELQRHAQVPLSQIQTSSGVSHGRNLFDSIVVFQNYPLDAGLGVGGEEKGIVAQARAAVEQTNYPLTLVALPGPEGELRLRLLYERERVNTALAERLLEHLEYLLFGLVEHPTSRPGELPLLSEQEQRQLLQEWNSSVTLESSSEPTLDARLERFVQGTPEAVAVSYSERDEDHYLSYAELGRRGRILAWELRSRGVQAGDLVGLCLERSLDLVVAIVGVLEAGAAYVPLDVAQPAERLAFILQDANLELVLTARDSSNALPLSKGVMALSLDDVHWDSKAATPVSLGAATAEGLAYVIYTSGSTGRPKGVGIRHHNVQRLLETTEGWFAFGPLDTWTLFHSYAFDFSVWELWGALFYGGRVVVVPYWVSRDPDALLELLRRQRVTVLNQTPSAFRQLVAAERVGEPGSLALREVIFGGEALAPSSLASWFALHGDARPRLVNMYGITETTVHVTFRALGASDAEREGLSPIGVPIPDLQVLVLDRRGGLVPPGVAGELCIGGRGLAMGYRSRPALTATRFVPNGFSQVPGERLYRSGDLGRHRPSGELEYLGRIDFQVKVRGFRIELGEIESALRRSDSVRAAVVLLRGEGGAGRLVAWVVPEKETTPEALREELLARLPEYMVPAAFVLLERFPLTVNGKIDRKALPEPEGERNLGASYTAPRSVEERALCEVFQEVLELDRVGVDDNFFTLGGDSILSLRILEKTRSKGFELDLQELFENPTPAALASVVRSIGDSEATFEPFDLVDSADRQALPSDLEDAFPLTRLQAGMLFESAGGDTGQYHNVLGVQLGTSFDEVSLRRAVELLVARHSVLRTSFDLTASTKPLQRVHRRAEIELAVEDLRSLGAEEQERRLALWFRREKARPFDWQRPGLLRFAVHRLAEELFHFGLTEHHAILDGWSVSLLFGELFSIYSALRRGESVDSKPLPSLVEVVALEQRALEDGQTKERWLELLDGVEPTRLPRLPDAATDEAALRELEESGAHHHEVEITSDLSRSLEALAQEIGVPVKSLLLAAHLRAVSRFGGRFDVVTGLVSNSRPEGAEGAAMLGLFLNNLPLRLQLDGGTWKELVRQTFEAEGEILPLRHYPMAQLLKERGGSPLYEVVFNYTHFHVLEALEASEELEVGDIASFAKTEMPFVADFGKEVGGGPLSLSLTVNPQEIAGAPLVRIGGLYRCALEAMVHNPDARYELDPLLEEGELRQLLLEWNATERPYPREETVPALFARQVEEVPASVAVVHRDQRVTYAELDRRSNGLAHHLLSLGVGQGKPVALFLDRSPEMITGLLAILKAGAPYVALDPAYPVERLRFLLEDTRVDVVLSSVDLAPTLPPFEGHLLRLDGPEGEGWKCGQHGALDVAAISPEHLAYVSYTSGSTGRPKGVEVRHRGVLRLLFGNDFAHFGPDRRLLQLSPVAFDASTVEIWGAMLHGGCCVLLPARLPTVGELGRVVQREAVDLLPLTTSLYNAVIDEAPEILRHVRELLVGGEALSVPHVRKGRDELPATRFIACYGPTESTTFTACYEVPRHLDPNATSIFLGGPIGNTQVHVMDRHLQPAPVAVFGELLIAGDGLARGYLARPGRTAQAFVPNPLATEPGGRLYRTGDLARWRPDGILEFGGRVDHQVKIRGFRIEPGEVEAQLLRLPGVREAAVVVREDRPGTKRLVAYWVGDDPAAGAELLASLREVLPEYMVPSALMHLEALPLSPTGKLDHRALPTPAEAAGEGVEHVAPRSSIERRLARLWEQLLGKDSVGIHDDFLALGGDSILAIQLVARARKEGLRLNPGQLFEHSTLAALARVVELEEDSESSARAESGVLVGAVSPWPVERAFFEQGFTTENHFNLAVLLASESPLAPQALYQVAGILLRQHDALRLRFPEQGGERHPRYGEVADDPFTLVELSGVAEERFSETVELVAAAMQRSLDVVRGPLFRMVLLRAGSQGPCRLLLVVHHLAVDGISWRILLEDVQVAYTQAIAEKPVELPPKTASLRQWSRALGEYAQSPRAAEEARWWLEQPWDEIATLPVEAEGANTEGSTQEVVARLSSERTQDLLHGAQTPYRTRVQEMLLAALARVLSRFTGGATVLLELEGHGRQPVADELDLSRTVGWFTALYPLLLTVDSAGSEAEDLIRAKDALRGIPNHGIGWGILRHLVDDPDLRNRLAALPAPEVVFNYLGQFDQVLEQDSAFRVAPESAGPPRAADGRRQALLEVNALVAGGRLEVRFTYSAHRHQPATMEGLVEAYLDEIHALLDHCQQTEGVLTPSDFPLVELSRESLEGLTAGHRVEDLYPLTPTQQGMLFHSLYDPDKGAYVSQLTCVLEGPLDDTTLRAAWREVSRHAVLRTAFVWEDPESMVQRVEEGAELPLEQEDWSGRSPSQVEERLAAYMQENRRRGFEVSQAPLVRVGHFSLGEGRHQLVWCFHHLLLDGWSLAIVLQELFAAFAAVQRGVRPELPEGRPYREYIAWRLRQDNAAAERFWRQQLEDFEEPTPLPTSTEASGERDERALFLGAERTAAVEDLARRHRVTVNHLFQATWALLLGHLGQAEDVVFGVTVSGRPADLPGVEEMVGLFINTVPLRLQLDPSASIEQWLEEVKALGAEMRRHEFAPLVQVSRWSGVPAGSSLFSSLLVFENYPVSQALEEGDSPGFRVEEVRVDSPPDYPLAVRVTPGQDLLLEILFDAGALEGRTADRILRLFEVAIEEWLELEAEDSVRELLGRLGREDRKMRRQAGRRLRGAGIESLVELKKK